jgi:long-chain acyl-CoA synthetase
MEHPWDRRLGVWWIAEDHPDALAVASSPSGTFTYAQLVGRAHQLVHGLRSLGLQAGDPVGAMLPNDVDLVVVSLACQESGLPFIPLNAYLTPSEVAAIIADSGARALIVHEQYAAVVTGELAAAVEAAEAHLLAVGEVPGARPLAEVVADQPSTIPENRTSGALFPYTSGTTGKPKGIMRRTANTDPSVAANDSAVFGRAFDFRPFDGPHLVSTGMYHGGSHSYYMGALHVGHALVIMPKFDAEEALRLIEQHRVRSAYMVPTQFSRLLRLPEEVRNRYDVSSLHSVVHSAAPCPRAVKQQMLDWWGPVIWETYGGMEGAATIAKPQRWLEHPGTVGRAVRGVTVTILDDDGNELGPNQTGHIYMKNSVGFEYHGDQEGTRKAFRGRRFTLGDVGYLDEDGYLFIQDRAKDMIITGGVNVYPAEVEAALSTHPAVADVAVIGIPDPDWGEQIKAVVELAPGYEPSDETAALLLQHSAEHLAAYKRPKSIDFRTGLPRTEAGKLYKRRIRDEYWEDRERMV